MHALGVCVVLAKPFPATTLVAAMDACRKPRP
jgi:hypothetical protein